MMGRLTSRKAKVFLLFLLCSFFAWAISKLSEEYESRTKFEVVYTNIPDSLLSKGNGRTNIAAKVKASGFQFLGYALAPKKIRLSLQNVLEEGGDYFLTSNTVKNQMEMQLPNRVSLIELDAPVFYTDLYLVSSKKVPIVPKIELRLAQNHLLDGKLKIVPDSVLVKGPEKDILTIKEVSTVPITLNELSKNFSEELLLQPLDSLGDIVINAKLAKVSGTVVRFSEKKFEVVLRTQNVPEGYRLRMFPDQIELVCKASIDRLKSLKSADFDVFVDYSSIVDNKYLFVELEEEPEGVFSVRLLQNRIEFFLEKI